MATIELEVKKIYPDISKSEPVSYTHLISQAGDCYFDRLKEYVRTYRYSQNAAKNTRIYMAKNGNDAAIIGAAMQEIRKS